MSATKDIIDDNGESESSEYYSSSSSSESSSSSDDDNVRPIRKKHREKGNAGSSSSRCSNDDDDDQNRMRNKTKVVHTSWKKNQDKGITEVTCPGMHHRGQLIESSVVSSVSGSDKSKVLVLPSCNTKHHLFFYFNSCY